jgi:hypothetical protein
MARRIINEYDTIRINDELLRRIESLERKVFHLQNRNQNLEKIMKDSFIGFKFNKEDRPNHSNYETDEIRRMRLISQIIARS